MISASARGSRDGPPIALSAGRVINASLVRSALGDSESAVPSLDEARDRFMANYLRQTLQLAEGNVSRAARLAGRNRTDFYKLMRRYGISADRGA